MGEARPKTRAAKAHMANGQFFASLTSVWESIGSWSLVSRTHRHQTPPAYLRRRFASSEYFPAAATAEVRSGFAPFFAPPRYYIMSWGDISAPCIRLDPQLGLSRSSRRISSTISPVTAAAPGRADPCSPSHVPLQLVCLPVYSTGTPSGRVCDT